MADPVASAVIAAATPRPGPSREASPRNTAPTATLVIGVTTAMTGSVISGRATW